MFLRLFFVLLAAGPLLMLGPEWLPTTDGAYYLSAAESLARGQGYRTLAGLPSKYPPLYSMLLAPWFWLPLPRGFIVSAVNAACLGAGAALTYRYFAQDGSRHRAMLLAAATAYATANLALVPEASTQLVYLALMMAALCAGRSLQSLRSAGLLAVLVALALTARTAGVTLVAGLAAASALLPGSTEDESVLRRFVRRRRLWMAPLAGALASVAFMGLVRGAGPRPIAVTPLVAEGVGYTEEFGEVAFDSGDRRPATAADVAARVGRNAVLYPLYAADAVIPGVFAFPEAGSVVFAWTALGFTLCLLRRPTEAEWVVAPYAVLLLIWPGGHGGNSYFAPFTPLMFHYALVPAEMALAYVAPAAASAARLLTFAGAVALVAAQAHGSAAIVASYRSTAYLHERLGGPGIEFLQACHWIDLHLPKDTIWMATRAPIFSYLTERVAYSEALTRDPDEQLAAMRTLGVTHVLAVPLHRWSNEFLLPAIRARPKAFKAIYRRGFATVYELIERAR